MAGIFDFMNDPESVGLLSASAAMFDRSNNTPQRMGLGQIITGGLLGGMQGYQGAMDGQQKREMQKQQLAMAKLKEAREQSQFDMQQNLIKEYMGGGGQSQPSMPAAMPGQLGSGMYGDIAPPEGMPAIPQMPTQQAAGQSTESARLNKLRAMAVAGVPGAKELFDIHKYENDPMKYEAGSMYKSRIDGSERIIPKLAEGATAVNGVYQNMPGYTDALAQIETSKATATERAKAGFDPLPVGYVGADSRPIGGTRLDYVQGGQQPSQPQQRAPMPMQPRAPMQSTSPQGGQAGTGDGLDISKLTPEQRAYLEKADPQAYANGMARFIGVSGQPQAGGRPMLQSESEKRALSDAQDISKAKVTGQMGVVQGAQTDLNKNWITNSYTPVSNAGKSAQDIQSQITALKGMDIKTGWGTEAKANAASFLTSLGIAPENAKLFAANAQKFQSISLDRMASELRKNTGVQTEGDAQRVLQTFAQLKNTPDANSFIMDFASAKANMDMRRSKYYEQAMPLAQQEGDLTKVDREWSKIQGSIWDDPILKPWKRSK